MAKMGPNLNVLRNLRRGGFQREQYNRVTGGEVRETRESDFTRPADCHQRQMECVLLCEIEFLWLAPQKFKRCSAKCCQVNNG